MIDRETLGQIVRQVWITWAKEQPESKPSWLVEWNGLSEPDKEVDRRIGERIAQVVLQPVWKQLTSVDPDSTNYCYELEQARRTVLHSIGPLLPDAYICAYCEQCYKAYEVDLDDDEPNAPCGHDKTALFDLVQK